MTSLQKLLNAIHNDKVYIQTHNFPDPDAIASAYGLQQLLRSQGKVSTICYEGKIERYNTNHIIEALGIEMVNVSELEMELQESDEILLVDVQKLNANVLDVPGEEIICIDHHPIVNQIEYRFSDIRPEMGACATIIASYFFENEIPMDRKTATVLTFGIRSDTDKLSRGVNEMDLEMLYRMFPIADKGLIYHLENAELLLSDLHAYAKAIDSIKRYGSVSFANAGKNCPEALVSCVSDFMLNMVEITFSVVYSRKPDGYKFSVRSEGDADAGKIVAQALKGIGSGGGHDIMAGGFAPFQGTEEEGREFIKEIERKFLEQLQAVSSC